MRMLSLLILLSLLISCSTSSPQPAAKVAAPSPVKVEAPSGAQLYAIYCASCHGEDGKGQGPAAPALKAKLPDLTTLARRKAGKFPEGDVYQVIKWGGGIVGHGSKEMPVWGEAFKPSADPDEKAADQRIRVLTTYIGTLQTK